MKRDDGMLKQLFDVEKKDIISFNGSGGKTTTIFKLARELKDNGKVLVTTSTKIGVPDNLEKGEKFFEDIRNILNNREEFSLAVAGNGILNGKINSIDEKMLNQIAEYFDYILIESDGSKRLPLKAWRDHEPVVLAGTNKTIGIIPIKYVDTEVDDSLIFNSEIFKMKFGFKSKLTFNVINNIIQSKDGIFKGAIGEKYIFFNQCNSNEDRDKARDLISYLEKYNKDINFRYG